MNKKTLQHGYSLLELIIYLALFAVFTVLITRSLITVMRTHAQASAYRYLQNNGSLVLERATREVRSAQSLSASGTPSTLTLVEPDGSGTKTVTFSVVNGAMQINDDGATDTLTTNNVSVTGFTAEPLTTAVSSGVKLTLTLTTTKGSIVTAPFYSTVLIRK